MSPSKLLRITRLTHGPDGTTFAKVGWLQQPDAHGVMRAGAFLKIGFMIKDKVRYASTAGWGWAEWVGAELGYKESMRKPPKAKARSLAAPPRVESLVHVIRGQKVMMDRDLAALYEVPTGRSTKLSDVMPNAFPTLLSSDQSDTPIRGLRLYGRVPPPSVMNDVVSLHNREPDPGHEGGQDIHRAGPSCSESFKTRAERKQMVVSPADFGHPPFERTKENGQSPKERCPSQFGLD